MYIGLPLLIILILVIIWMANELRNRKKRIQLLTWDIFNLNDLLGGKYILPVLSRIESKFYAVNKSSGGHSPQTIKRLQERIERYEGSTDFSILQDEVDRSVFWGNSDQINVRNEMASQFSYLGFEFLESYYKKTPDSKYKRDFEDD
jgi:hypothetical protein